MMEYFRLRQSDGLCNPFCVQGLDPGIYKANPTEKDFEQIPKMLVTYFDYAPDSDIPEYVLTPTPMVSKRLRDVFQMYDEEIKFKGVQCYPNRIEDAALAAPLFWAYYCEQLPCLHSKAGLAPNGAVMDLIINKNKLRGRDIIVIGGIQEKITIVSLAVAESIMRRNIFGVSFEEVDIR